MHKKHRLIFRTPDPIIDFPPLVAMLNKIWHDPITVAMLQEWDEQLVAGRIQRRQVAITSDGELVGYSLVLHHASAPNGRFFLWVGVDPAYRGQGVGTAVYEEALAFALSVGADDLRSELYDNDEGSLRFAQQRGFTIRRHVFESAIVLKDFDETVYADLIESVRATGIRFFSLADEDNERIRHQLHAVNRRTVLDDPGSRGYFFDYDEFWARLDQSTWFLPEGQLMAADGDKVIGLAAVGYFAHTNSMTNMMTGVDKGYRGRKIAQCLKLLTIHLAKSRGVDYISTYNDAENGAMLAINRKLGYKPRVGEYDLIQKL